MKEKVCIYGRPKFRDLGLEGHLLMIVWALYGLKTSGAQWHDHFADTLCMIGFTPCKADTDVWMRAMDGIYEFIWVYVDDLMMAMKDLAAFCELLKSEHGYKLKGDGDLKYCTTLVVISAETRTVPTTMVRLSMWKRCWMRMNVCLAKSLWDTPRP